MAAVAAMIFHAVEEMNFPQLDSSEVAADRDNMHPYAIRFPIVQVSYHTLINNFLIAQNETLGGLVRAMNTVSCPLGSSESLATLSSVNSFSELHDLNAHEEALSSQLFHAVEMLTLDAYDSSNNLQTYPHDSSLNQMTFIRFVISALEEFNAIEDSSSSTEETNSYRKFC